MKMSKDSQVIISNEIKYAVEQMKQSKDLEEKIYYFSAVHAMILRIFNINYDPYLVYIHLILNETYSAFMQRLAAMKRGDSVVEITVDQINRLEDLTVELGMYFNKAKEVDEIMKKFAILSYSTTGNGHYLLKKGLLVI